MENLFYTPDDKTAFWVSGYTTDGNGKVIEVIESLQLNAEKFAAAVGCNPEDVGTFYVTTSRRYKYMRVFFVRMDNPPEDAFVFSEGWYMHKWLQD